MALALVFAEAAGEPLADTAALELALAAAVAAARAAHPNIGVTPEQLAAYLGAHVDARADLAALPIADLYLACGCVHGDPAALATFEREYMARVGDYIARIATAPAVVDEVAQTLRQRLLVATAERAPRITDYRGHGALGGFIRIAAVRTALNARRGDARATYTSDAVDDAPAGADHGTQLEKAEVQAAFEQAFAACVTTLGAEDRSLLRLHYLDGLTFEQMAKLLDTPRSTVARRLTRCREELVRATRRDLAERLRLGDTELDSVMRVAVSRLELTISRLLQ